jgi:protein-tyrosine phosphatase
MNHKINLKSKTPKARTIDINGLSNARDLGGLSVGGENLTNFRVVVRGESPQLITKNGIKSIKEYNITDVVDLRSNLESKNLGYGHASELKIHPAPMIKDSSFISNVGIRLGRKHEYENYLKEGRKSFKILFAAINNAAGAVYLHCAVGKDRTGVVSSVLLMALGVSREDILNDYIYSKQSVKLILPSLASSGVYNDFANPNWNYQIPKADDISHIIDFIGDQAGALKYLTSCGISKKEISAFNSKFLS